MRYKILASPLSPLSSLLSPLHSLLLLTLLLSHHFRSIHPHCHSLVDPSSPIFTLFAFSFRGTIHSFIMLSLCLFFSALCAIAQAGLHPRHSHGARRGAPTTTTITAPFVDPTSSPSSSPSPDPASGGGGGRSGSTGGGRGIIYASNAELAAFGDDIQLSTSWGPTDLGGKLGSFVPMCWGIDDKRGPPSISSSWLQFPWVRSNVNDMGRHRFLHNRQLRRRRDSDWLQRTRQVRSPKRLPHSIN